MFEQTFFLYFLILIPLFIGLFVWRGFVRLSVLRRIGDKELIDALTARISPFRRQLKSILWLIAFGSLILALARPVWGVEREIIQKEGVQIIVAMDISRSMDANDISPSRLARARFDTFELLGALNGNDIGIVLFTTEAFVYMPLTYDIGATEIFLNDIGTHMISQQGTSIPAAIEIALGAFDQSSRAQRVILLISDGESHEGDAVAAAQMAAEEDVRIYTIGYGTQEGSNIPIYNDNNELVGYQTAGESTIVTTALNVSLLQRVAGETGGFYISGSVDLQPLITDIQLLQVGDIGEEIITRPIERFIIFVVIAVATLSIEMILPETRQDDDDVA